MKDVIERLAESPDDIVGKMPRGGHDEAQFFTRAEMKDRSSFTVSIWFAFGFRVLKKFEDREGKRWHKK